jgi:uncharacterized membrane protein YvbJ
VVECISSDIIADQKCSKCGSEILKPEQETGRAQEKSSGIRMNQSQKVKGGLPSRNKMTIAIGLVVVLLIMSIFREGVSALREQSTPLTIIGGGVAIIAIIIIGVWFEKKSRR